MNHLSKIIDCEQSKIAPDNRNYLGAALVGHTCDRHIYYKLNYYTSTPLPSALYRTFAIGKNLESLVLDWLKKCTPLEIVLPTEENNFLEVCDVEIKKFKGHLDAIIEPHNIILEIKTANNSNFNLFVKNGLRKWNPKYYAQVQAYMGFKKSSQAIVLVLNKDNSALHDETIDFDEMYFTYLQSRAKALLTLKTEPERINSSPLFYMCSHCEFKNICHTASNITKT